MKIAFFNTKSYDRAHFGPATEHSHHEFAFFEDALSLQTAALVQGFDAVCIFVNNPVSEALVKQISDYGIKIIALRSAGFNQVDLNACSKHDITVVRVPAYSPEAVAEHTVALILTLNRKTHKAYNRVRENNYSLEGLTGINLHQKTVGIIGTGTIGTAFCRVMRGFDCKILAFDPNENKEVTDMCGTYTEFDELIASSDIISMHCPLIPQTRHMIDKESIRRMKEGVMLINTSRGALIDTAAVIDGLKQKKIGFLGIDVYEQEDDLFFKDLSGEVIQDDEIARLMTFPNVLITGHQAFLTTEALAQITRITLQNLSDFEEGKSLVNEVTADKNITS